jgi:uncharacterized protein
MPDSLPPQYSAFQGTRLLATGSLTDVSLRARQALDGGAHPPVVVFDDRTGRVVELNADGGPGEALPRPRRPGRPRLGVVAREVTLLPRHWDWLAQQPGGASVALRRLVEAALVPEEAG